MPKIKGELTVKTLKEKAAFVALAGDPVALQKAKEAILDELFSDTRVIIVGDLLFKEDA